MYITDLLYAIVIGNLTLKNERINVIYDWIDDFRLKFHKINSYLELNSRYLQIMHSVFN